MIKHFQRVLVTGVAAWAIMAVNAVAAQPELDPGRVEQRFDVEERLDVQGPPLVSPGEPPVLPEEKAGAEFQLNDVKIVGGTAFSDAEFAPLYKDRVGQKVTLGDVRAIANKVTFYYRNAGYILSRAVVPAQRVEGGVVTIQVVEGYIDGVTFEGGETQDADLLASYAANITGMKPVTNEAIERYLLLIDDITGIKARGVLAPSATNTGASQLIVALDYDQIEGEVSVNNRGSRFLGPIQTGATVGFNSLLGLSERVQLRTVVSGNLDELRYYEANYLQPIGGEGTTLRGLVSLAETNPGASLEPLDIDGESVGLTFSARHPFLRSRKENLFGNAGFRYRNSESVLGLFSTELYDDHVRSLYAGVNYDILDGLRGINRIDGEVSQGLDILDGNDAGDLLSRANGKNAFTKIEAQYSRLQPIEGNFSAYLGLSAQYAFDPLLASEEFGIGGEPFGSAYDPAEITGDHGIAGRLELRYSDALPDTWLDVYQLYAFYDGGRVYNRDTIAGEKSNESLTSAGVGLRMNLINDIAATLEIAKPLTRDVAAEGSDGEDVRGFFSLVYGF